MLQTVSIIIKCTVCSFLVEIKILNERLWQYFWNTTLEIKSKQTNKQMYFQKGMWVERELHMQFMSKMRKGRDIWQFMSKMRKGRDVCAQNSKQWKVHSYSKRTMSPVKNRTVEATNRLLSTVIGMLHVSVRQWAYYTNSKSKPGGFEFDPKLKLKSNCPSWFTELFEEVQSPAYSFLV